MLQVVVLILIDNVGKCQTRCSERLSLPHWQTQPRHLWSVRPQYIRHIPWPRCSRADGRTCTASNRTQRERISGGGGSLMQGAVVQRSPGYASHTAHTALLTLLLYERVRGKRMFLCVVLPAQPLTHPRGCTSELLPTFAPNPMPPTYVSISAQRPNQGCLHERTSAN